MDKNQGNAAADEALAPVDKVPPRERLKRALQKGFRTVGYHVGKFPPVGSLEHHLELLLTKLDINCVIDVGGHHGEFATLLRDIGYQGRIVSFEPVKHTFAILSRKMASDPQWRGMNMALGANDGELTINVYHEGSVFNSFLPASDYGKQRFAPAMVPAPQPEQVQVRRLDGIIDEVIKGIASPRVFLKMDTQGWDTKVVEGAQRRIDLIVALQSELAAKPIYDGMPTFNESLATYQRLGFELTGIFSVARDNDGLRLVEFDCVMLRPPRSGATG